MVKDKYNSDCGGQPVATNAEAASVLAQGSNKSKQVPVKWGMKDRDSGSEGLARKGSSDPYSGAR
jgi:hypothetical protein